jgi:hypothetical protein
MAAPLIAQEVYLLERYASLDYFGDMRDAFAACVKAAEDGLAAFMAKLPPDYRKRPLWDQPDRAWGERVIPNMQWALRGLNDGYIALSRGDADALGMAGNVMTTFASIGRDFSWEWLPQPFYDSYDRAETGARQKARNINATQQGNWQAQELSSDYQEQSRGALDSPASWPTYRLNPKVQVKTGDKVPRSGVYLPSAEHGCAQFLIQGYKAWHVSVPNRFTTPDDHGDTELTTAWTLVERVSDTGGGDPSDADPGRAGIRLRCEAGQPCPREGWWFTPASVNSRRHFKAGELMPDLKSDWGATIWQWDEQQQ